MRLIYISQGNIPSKWAHTFQAMKTAEAFGQLVPDFRLLTQIHWTGLFRRRFDYESWYGVRHRFRITRLPVASASRGPLFEEVRYPAFDRRAVRYAAKMRPDVVYTRSEPAGALLARMGLTTLIETHTHNEHWAFKLVVEAASSQHVLGIVTISDVIKEQLIQNHVPPEKILVWPDAVDDSFLSSRPSRMAARFGIGMPTQGPIALYCGHLYEWKGIGSIVDAARLLPEVQFVVVGGWPQDIERWRSKSGEVGNVTFIGFVPNSRVAEYLAAADALLLPNSRCDPVQAIITSPLKLFEYMASGVPIVASDLPAIRLHLKNDHNAVLVQPDSGGSLAAGIRCVLESADRGRALGEAARNDVARFTWNNRARTILKTFCGGS